MRRAGAGLTTPARTGMAVREGVAGTAEAGGVGVKAGAPVVPPIGLGALGILVAAIGWVGVAPVGAVDPPVDSGGPVGDAAGTLGEVGAGRDVAVAGGLVVGTLVEDGVAVGLAVEDGVAVGALVSVGVSVESGVLVGVGESVGDGVAVEGGVLVGVAVGESVGVLVGVAVGESVGVLVSIGVSVGNGVAVGVSVRDGVAVGVVVADGRFLLGPTLPKSIAVGMDMDAVEGERRPAPLAADGELGGEAPLAAFPSTGAP